MENEEISLIVSCWHDLQAGSIRLRVMRVSTSEEVQLRDSTFLLRISPEAGASVQRCLIRHLASGREAYIQGGPNLRAFVKTCLLNSDESAPATPDAP